MRIVTDVLTVGGAPVAFDEVTLGTYQGVCPWCTNNLGVARAKTFGKLYGVLFDQVRTHMPECEGRHLTEMRVQAKGLNAN